jgi:hypothetical protein
MKTVTANVYYPVYGMSVEVEDGATETEIRKALVKEADRAMESTRIDPVIGECSVPELNDD